MKVQADAWKVAADGAWTTQEALRTGTTGWETVLSTATTTATDADTACSAAKTLYDDEIIKPAVTTSTSTAGTDLGPVTTARSDADTTRQNLNTALAAIVTEEDKIVAE